MHAWLICNKDEILREHLVRMEQLLCEVASDPVKVLAPEIRTAVDEWPPVRPELRSPAVVSPLNRHEDPVT